MKKWVIRKGGKRRKLKRKGAREEKYKTKNTSKEGKVGEERTQHSTFAIIMRRGRNEGEETAKNE